MVSKYSSINGVKNQAVDFYQSSTAGAYLVLSLGLKEPSFHSEPKIECDFPPLRQLR